MKRKYGKKKEGGADGVSSAKDLWACPTFHIVVPAGVPAGEDERTREMFIKKLRVETNLVSIKIGMDATHHHRRLMIKASESIASILDIYPVLGRNEQVRVLPKYHYLL